MCILKSHVMVLKVFMKKKENNTSSFICEKKILILANLREICLSASYLKITNTDSEHCLIVWIQIRHKCWAWSGSRLFLKAFSRQNILKETTSSEKMI